MDASPEGLQALGRVTMLFSGIEVLTGVVLSGFISADPSVAQILPADEGFEWRLRKLRALTSHVLDDGDLKDELLAWISDADKLREERNRLTHGMLEATPGGFKRLRITARRRWEWV